MGPRFLLFALAVLVGPLTASAGTNVEASCYKDCESSTTSNPDYKACVARAADEADGALNQAYKDLLAAVRAGGTETGQPADTQIDDLKDAQKQWIAFRDGNCTFEDSLAFGGTSIGGNYSSCLCALSYTRVKDFERIEKNVLGGQ